jgi:hypothetical protein
MMSLKVLKEHHYTKQSGTLCINQRGRPKVALWPDVSLCDTGQGGLYDLSCRTFSRHDDD